LRLDSTTSSAQRRLTAAWQVSPPASRATQSPFPFLLSAFALIPAFSFQLFSFSAFVPKLSSNGGGFVQSMRHGEAKEKCGGSGAGEEGAGLNGRFT